MNTPQNKGSVTAGIGATLGLIATMSLAFAGWATMSIKETATDLGNVKVQAAAVQANVNGIDKRLERIEIKLDKLIEQR